MTNIAENKTNKPSFAKATAGKVKQVIGAVVDVHFETELPEIYTALEVERGGKSLILETQQHIGS
ncbi:F0F1 ATP synthase subunit beta, partial [Candidatus Parcubacteria bacterium]|nr:F0F1 ATP synthase subunit beta [Candidatus Parcubacteria bacterium]